MPAIFTLAVRPDLILLTNASATGAAVPVPGGVYVWGVDGTWTGATAQLQWRRGSSRPWIDLDGMTLTADGGFNNVPLARGEARVTITGGTSPSLSSQLGGIA